MTIEINRNTEFTYRINPTDGRQVDRRLNQRGQHWYFWLRRDSPNEAKAALLRLTGDQEGEART